MLNENKIVKARGFTFTEIMIALVLNTLLVSGLIALYLSNIEHYRKTIQTNRLNYQLQSILQIISNDIRRAGFWQNAYSDIGTGQNNNPFMATGVDINVNGSNNCILFAYDKNSDGSLPTISTNYDDERYGYRLSNQAIQGRPPGAGFDCNATNWETMTDTNYVQITALNFALTNQTLVTGPGTTGITLRSVDMTITGRLKNDPTVTRTLTQHIRVRNDKFVP